MTDKTYIDDSLSEVEQVINLYRDKRKELKEKEDYKESEIKTITSQLNIENDNLREIQTDILEVDKRLQEYLIVEKVLKELKGLEVEEPNIDTGSINEDGEEEITINRIPIDEIEEFVQPQGSNDAYKVGDIIKFDDNFYISIIDNNIWSPIAYPGGWSEVGIDG